MTGKVLLSVVVPVFNESESISEFCRVLRLNLDQMNINYEVLFIDDGSKDNSVELIEEANWTNARVISFVVNSGHMAALDAGYRASNAEYTVTLDSDLQHPPELIPQMLETAISKKLDVVYAYRSDREDDAYFKRATAIAYYKAIRGLSGINLTNSAADFRLVSRHVTDVIKALPQGQQVFRLLIPSLGFPSTTIPYLAQERFAGQSKYSLRKMAKLALSSLVGFSTKPLTISIGLGVAYSLLAIVGFIYAIVTYLSGNSAQGWASLISTVLLSFGILFLILGIIGIYIANIAEITRARPNYIIRNIASPTAPKVEE